MASSSRGLARPIRWCLVERTDTLDMPSERFERRLTQEISTLRLELTQEISTVRLEMHNGLASVREEMHSGLASVREEMHSGLASVRSEMHSGLSSVRAEIATTRVELLKWSFAFWVGQVAVMTGLLAFMLRK